LAQVLQVVVCKVILQPTALNDPGTQQRGALNY